MNSKTKILCTAMATGICIAGSSMAAGLQATDSVETNALVLEEFDRIHIETPTAADLAVMNVRIFGPDNELVLSTRTKDESVEFLVNGELPDGEYRYETFSIFGNVDLSDRSKYVEGETTYRRNFGSFTVSNGRVVEKVPQSQLNDASLMDKIIKQAVNLAGITLDVLIPSAHAQDLTATSFSPSIFFNDNDDADCSPAWDWSVRAEGGSSDGDLLNSYAIKGVGEGAGPCFNDVDIVKLNHDGNTGPDSSENSLIVDSDGDIHWAQNRLNFDKGVSSLGIGTNDSSADLVISSLDPTVKMWSEAWGDYMYSNYDGFYYNIGWGGNSLARFSYAAPESSLLLDGYGNLGLGTTEASPPMASLEVRRSDGTAAILVEEQNPVSETRNMFSLINKGLTKFIINNLDGAEWAFANKGTSFRISRQGSGEVEMELYNNGDVVFAGLAYQNSDVNAKTNIEAVDQRSVLERITDLQISQWQYKDALGENHIGPMAQDFYAAFGLGKGDTNLSTIDTSGVALAAIQALAAENKTLREQVQSQQDRLDALENHQIEIQAMMTSLIEAQNGSPVLTKTAMK